MSEVKETSVPLVFIDTAGCGLHELETEDGDSKGNEGTMTYVKGVVRMHVHVCT